MHALKRVVALAVAVLTIGMFASAAAKDVWDLATPTDNTAAGTLNELGFGTEQVHDLEAVGAVPDEDWFIINLEGGKSYQILVRAVTGEVDMSQADFVQRYDSAGTTLLQSQGGNINTRILRFICCAQGEPFQQRIRVKGVGTNTANSQYNIAFSQTTAYCARFNSTATQLSVLLLQNATSGSSCFFIANFFNEAGTFLFQDSGTIPASGMHTLNTSNVGALAGQRGSLYFSHTCGGNAVRGKVVALESTTGYSFDTPCERR